MIRCFAVLALPAWLVAGCSIDFVSPGDPKIFLPDRSTEVAIGQMDRRAVRSVLGAPLVSSAYWGFDLFRTDADQTVVSFPVVLVPSPIPVMLEDRLQRYTLVAYGTNGSASAAATGLYRVKHYFGPIEHDFPRLYLRAGELMFFIDPAWSQEPNLLVAPAGRDAFLQYARSSHDCMAVLGCGSRGCGDQLAIDAGAVRRLPTRNPFAFSFSRTEAAPDAWLSGVKSLAEDTQAPWLETLVAVKLSAGEHVLHFSAKSFVGKHAMKFTCVPGEVTYLVVNATVTGGLTAQALVEWQIDRRGALPERFARRPLVLMDDGQWHVDPEPSN